MISTPTALCLLLGVLLTIFINNHRRWVKKLRLLPIDLLPTDLFPGEEQKIQFGRRDVPFWIRNRRQVSRKHFLITFPGGKIYITDTGSTNGVYVDGERIPMNEPYLLIEPLRAKIELTNGGGPLVVISDWSRHQGYYLLKFESRPKAQRTKA